MSIVRAQAAAHDSAIPLQPASHDIWDKKYRLKAKSGEPVDADVDGTYQRVAKALSDVEATEELRATWNERFLWALRRGAIPAGRITSNAGALAHKPATSTINCTVSGTITDSMDDILEKVHEAGLTLKAGCGIGYEFSTLRPRGAYVSGAGAHTSGPLSFMDIYDKMCFTVSSAGGRRGAQMGTFDISHPDAKEFIRAKREDGRLRQFNLSLLITDGFMDAVADDADWPLVFPVHVKEEHEVNLQDPTQVVWREWPTTVNYVAREDGLVACKIYGHIRARHLWDMIMVSTYDFAEPGFILIDRVNEMNNNWWCEHIRATNPCVTADTWVQTAEGPKQVADLIGTPFQARVDGKDHLTGPEGFFLTAHKAVVKLATKEGHALRLTADHRVRKVTNAFAAGIQGTEWCAAGELKAGDQVLLNNHTSNTHWTGAHVREEGYLLGLLVASDGLSAARSKLSFQVPAKTVNGKDTSFGVWALQDAAFDAAQTLGLADADHGYANVLQLPSMGSLANTLGLEAGAAAWGANVEKTSSAFYRGFLSGLFDVSGSVLSDRVVLQARSAAQAATVQRMLLRLGVASVVDAATVTLRGSNVEAFSASVSFGSVELQDRLDRLVVDTLYNAPAERFTATIASITPDGEEAVYDVQVPGINTFDANGLHAHNCGEQPLPPYGSCLLGSINLTTFVRDPFGPKARFDWDEYREVVKVFTRMLDNVVEINGLPLEKQRHEIVSKRRHGMGFLGLGSTLTMLKMRYGTADAVTFTEDVSREMAVAGWEMALDLAKEKGPAPILAEEFEVTAEMLRKRPEMVKDGYKVGQKIRGSVLHAKYSRYMQRVAEVAPELVAKLAETGARFTHHSSIAPTGTISLSLANNASNGIEPSFAHHYSRNVIREGKKSKEKVEVYSYELLAYRALINADALPFSEDPKSKLPEYFVSADDISPKEHVDIQAASQKWIDSSISKTANVPTDYPYEDFKDIYFYAYKQGLKGCTTFRFNPAAFQGVLVKESDLESTLYRFELEDGSVVELKGNEQVEYDGEMHSAANLFDALKEGYYGKF
ncbi:MAG TPA: LAGLIDADG family homing endonuclease [Pinirhizobacter sp.]|uniref:LAGLIDADG family homing endonuclease n=1 Tax=Pinirhizobacter sp. TaxID=2950432 RepID=UPI002C989ACB|nr:LAGLIDADG family homing endonuclease [Pinirhizobacter sp.]HMH69347.1 LAGLIDADG family homing endonuclease [Pinirhizobacter sp.]